MADPSSAKVYVSDGIAEIRLSNPDGLNAITVDLMENMISKFGDIASRDDVRVVVIGSVGRAFSAGGDFDLILEQQRSAASRERSAELSRRYFAALIGCAVPIVAAIQGDAIGAGLTLALCCDAIVCSKTARLADPHVAVALATGDGAAILWPQAIGLLRARRYLLTGDRITAQEAHAMGLVTDLVESPDDALPAAHAIATRIAALAPMAVRHTKKALIDGLRPLIDATFEHALALEMETFASQDVIEAIGAIRERRTPTFVGR